MFSDFLKQTYFNNTVAAYAGALGTMLAGVTILWVVKVIVLIRVKKWAERTATRFDDFIVMAVNRFLMPILYFGVIYTALNGLKLNPGVQKGLHAFSVVIVTFLGIRFLSAALRFAIFNVYLGRKQNAVQLQNRFSGLMPALTVVIWVAGVMFLLDNLGFQISTIIAGLGIGGAAIALASSVVLADLFCYFAISVDQPFQIGDFIIIGDFMGSVEHIGVKTTRLRSLGGELLIFSNKDLTESRIRNYKQMAERRVEFKFGVAYHTSQEQLRAIPDIVKAAVAKDKRTRFDRSHFGSFDDSSLTIANVYIVLTDDYNAYMDIQQTINLHIKEEFEKRGIEFAFPTRTVHIASAPPALMDAKNGKETPVPVSRG